MKSCFEHYPGFEGFLAHEDIAPSLDWPPEIIKRLKESDIFILLASNSSKKSIFANQEIGMSIILNKKIIPIKIEDVDPFGFISNLQACKCTDFTEKGLLEIVFKIVFLLVNDPKCIQYRSRSIDSIIFSLSKSDSFNRTRVILRILIQIDKNVEFSSEQIKNVILAIRGNSQVNNELYVLPDFKSILEKKYRVGIDT